ncbi:PREDICTED: coiled-coil domain-containing protein 22 homolog [Priapulus caudatus]|uniref:Coiled-coil domain-containing protein 22 homolog n=1 Tax=Priapulus caudatus TaxID=37621 RepID=A0ABM1EQ36_PRICU|nr:PREDICTED: coiled-coil domain-containing protein 22 homolog [Priapulus caudatus]
MEEVDNIIIHSLRQIGCDVEDEVQSLRDFSTATVVEAAVKCLCVIDQKFDMSPVLPPGMSARYRIGTSLAEACVEIGYKGEIGYQTFLYANETDVRKILIFLLEKIPKESAATAEEPAGSSSALMSQAICNEIKRRLQLPMRPLRVCHGGLRLRDSLTQSHRQDYSNTWPFHAVSVNLPEGVSDLTKPQSLEFGLSVIDCESLGRCKPEDVAPSVLEANALQLTIAQEWEAEWNQSGLHSRLTQEEYRARKHQRLHKRIADHLTRAVQAASGDSDASALTGVHTERPVARVKGSRFTHSEKLQFTKQEEKPSEAVKPQAETEEDIQKHREQEFESLKTQLDGLSDRLENTKLETRQYSTSIDKRSLSELEQTKRRAEGHLQGQKRVLDLLPDAENNIAKLQNVIATKCRKLVNLGNQWENHRGPLMEQYNTLKEQNGCRLSETEKKLEEIKRLREKMRALATDTRAKDDLYKQLVAEYERTTKDVNRAAYTKRILEIITNINKQNQDIQKVLSDTKEVQKEINVLSGKLDRTFTVTDELIFKDAKKDESVRKAYKYLASLHENCSQLIKTVEDTGVIMREIRDLEDQIESESNKRTLANLQRIQADYHEMKKENAALMSQLKQLQ